MDQEFVKRFAQQKVQAIAYADRIELIPVRSAKELRGILCPCPFLCLCPDKLSVAPVPL